jgi:hypothetical protein
MGHFAKFFPLPKKKTNVYPARVHHTTTDEIAEGEPVMAGTFLWTITPMLSYLILDLLIHLWVMHLLIDINY